MDTFKIRALRLIARVYQSFKTGFHKRGNAAAQNALFAEQVGLGFLGEGGFQNAAPAAADGRSVGKGNFFGVARRVVFHGDEAGDAFIFLILASYRVAGAFGGYHNYVHVLWGDDLSVTDIEPVGKAQGHARFQIWRNTALVDGLHFLVVDE